MLLSFKKKVEASSSTPGFPPENAVNEDIRTYWIAADNKPGQHICVDLENVYQVNAIQLNLGDHKLSLNVSPKEEWVGDYSKRIIVSNCGAAEYTIEISKDKENWQVVKDSRGSLEDHTHEYVTFEAPVNVRYIRATGYNMPFDAPFTVSGIRVFGTGNGTVPAKAIIIQAERTGVMDVYLKWNSDGAIGYNIKYGIDKGKLYSSWLLYERTELNIGTLTKGQKYYVQIDAFNENGITEGDIIEV
jgi:hypothetical protein